MPDAEPEDEADGGDSGECPEHAGPGHRLALNAHDRREEAEVDHADVVPADFEERSRGVAAEDREGHSGPIAFVRIDAKGNPVERRETGRGREAEDQDDREREEAAAWPARKRRRGVPARREGRELSSEKAGRRDQEDRRDPRTFRRNLAVLGVEPQAPDDRRDRSQGGAGEREKKARALPARG